MADQTNTNPCPLAVNMLPRYALRSLPDGESHMEEVPASSGGFVYLLLADVERLLSAATPVATIGCDSDGDMRISVHAALQLGTKLYAVPADAKVAELVAALRASDEWVRAAKEQGCKLPCENTLRNNRAALAAFSEVRS